MGCNWASDSVNLMPRLSLLVILLFAVIMLSLSVSIFCEIRRYSCSVAVAKTYHFQKNDHFIV